MTSSATSLLAIHPEVREALAAKNAVVALESTIISHGMPYPQNAQTAREVEAEIRRYGAIPATIAVMGGKICIGLSDAQIEQLAQAKDALKLSRRDMAYALSSQRLGATTVAATMMAAQLAGIEVFVTGGIGGVHRGAAQSFDISADLQELARTPVAVVCAGAKAILDLPLTLEYLETHGVPVVGIEQEEFAAFFSRSSGLKADFRLDTPVQQAQFARAHWQLGGQGIVLSNPVQQAQEIAREQIDGIIQTALHEAQTQQVQGKAVTPFLLKRINELTQGASLRTNIALVKNNARVGAQLAVALCDLSAS